MSGFDDGFKMKNLRIALFAKQATSYFYEKNILTDSLKQEARSSG